MTKDLKIPFYTAKLDKDGTLLDEKTCNMENLIFSDWEIKQFSKWLVEACEEYFKGPKVVDRFNKWKVERDAKLNKTK